MPECGHGVEIIGLVEQSNMLYERAHIFQIHLLE